MEKEAKKSTFKVYNSEELRETIRTMYEVYERITEELFRTMDADMQYKFRGKDGRIYTLTATRDKRFIPKRPTN